MDVHGSYIAYGGSHPVVTETHKNAAVVSVNHLSVFFSNIAGLCTVPELGLAPKYEKSYFPPAFYMSEHQTALMFPTPLSLDDMLQSGSPNKISNYLSQLLTPNESCTHTCHKARIPIDTLKQLMDSEVDPLVSYRCKDCEDCENCKASPRLRSISLKERTEQKLIESSVRIDYEEGTIYAKFPFTEDPDLFLSKMFPGQSSNFTQANKVYLTQCRKDTDTKLGIQSAMNDLITVGYLQPLDLASPNIKQAVEEAGFRHFQPWRATYKESVSTPVRLVSDPSFSFLNLILAKGEGGLSSMSSILLNSRSAPCVWASDI